jgi:hypothetical protein
MCVEPSYCIVGDLRVAEWIEKSNRNRHRQCNQQGGDDDEVVVNHTYGVDGHIRLAKRMVSM